MAKIKFPEMQLKTLLKTAVITVIVMSILLYAPSPFVVVRPGIVVSTDNIVQYQSGGLDEEQYSQEKGSFLLTAVLMDAPNIWNALLASFRFDQTVMLKQSVLGNNTIEQYSQRATTMMQGSYDHALEAAYQYMHIEYSYAPKALYVDETQASTLGFGSGDGLEAGDEIVAIQGQDMQIEIRSVDDLRQYLQNNTQQSTIDLTIMRLNEQQTITLEKKDSQLDAITDEWVGDQLGVKKFTELQHIQPADSKYAISFEDTIIGGPSAGLILTLTIIDTLTQGDLTGGMKIAATGTIDRNGQVGEIGGIEQKVISTSEAGAKVFLVPKGNEAEARKKVKRLKSDMEIYGVSNLEEAMKLIASL